MTYESRVTFDRRAAACPSRAHQERLETEYVTECAHSAPPAGPASLDTWQP